MQSKQDCKETSIFKDNIAISRTTYFEGLPFIEKSNFDKIISLKKIITFNTPNLSALFSNKLQIRLSEKRFQFRGNADFPAKIFSYNLKQQNYDDINQNNLSEYFDLDTSFIEKLALYSPIKNIRIPKEPIRQYKRDNTIFVENIFLEFFVNGEWWSWNHLSDGTKRLFYIISSIAAPYSNAKLILLEEPEVGIHPQQLSRLMDFLRMEADEKQIIITTHSPQVLNELKENELDRIIIANYLPEKGTTLSHLSEDDKAFALSYMKEGAFLSDYWVQSGFSQEQTEIY